jgi:chorismate dehydratase
VGTVLFASRLPLAEVRSVAMDVRSRTSAALLQVLFGKEFSSNISLEPANPDPEIMLKNHDAALIIGDPAFGLRSAYPDLKIYDLSEQWFEQTDKTFVHAIVAVRNGIELHQEFLTMVREAKMEGLSRVESIARTESERSGLDFETCFDYLSTKIIYDLGEEEIIGLQHFRDLCFEKDILDQKEAIQFV